MAAAPVLQVAVNAESVVNETVEFLQSARVEMKAITKILRQRMNKTMDEVDSDVAEILRNVVAITGHVSRLTDTFSQPAFALIIIVVVVVFLVLLAVFMLLRTCRECSKPPLQLRLRCRKKKGHESLPTTRPRDSFRASVV
ncbi:hypothetical protein QR680_005061 [Steinernema hermaphroditum]|uniref:Uncharacterized protein n=1 Tax=Steinernema hermaphroditum TaxID=289476 RepID=A0AA39LUP1_9BILA|nr:hypothetical protein QR680_005061 [Steinernema hermaphroditum]